MGKKFSNDKQAITFLWIMAIHIIDVSYAHSQPATPYSNSKSIANRTPFSQTGYFDTSLESGISASSQYVNIIKLIDTIAYLEFVQCTMRRERVRCVWKSYVSQMLTMHVILTKLNKEKRREKTLMLQINHWFFYLIQAIFHYAKNLVILHWLNGTCGTRMQCNAIGTLQMLPILC